MMDAIQLSNKLSDYLATHTTRYDDVLYPRSLLTIYESTMKGEFMGGNPEQLADSILKDFIDKITDKSGYIFKLRQAMLVDDRIRDCAVMRLNYAALLEEVIDTIAIHSVVKGRLPCTNPDEIVPDEDGSPVFTGKSPSEMKLAEIEKGSNDFYAQKRVIKQEKLGLPENKRAYIATKVRELGCELILDKEIVYNKLNQYLNDDYEVSIVARIIYLFVMKEINMTIDNPNGKIPS